MLAETLAWIQPAIAAYGPYAILVIIYFESFGVPLPGESALITASLLAAHGELNIKYLFLAAWIGSVFGDNTGYLIGLFGGRVLIQRFGGRVGLTPERYARLEKAARQRGFIMVLTARFIVVLRQLNGITAGSVGMPWPRFLVANALGAGLWSGLWTIGPYYFDELIRRWI
jgi:membrane protein DedA with SNARE-associated domain